MKKQDPNLKRKLFWKYLLQQKAIEAIGMPLLILFIVYVPYYVGHHIGDNKSTICDRIDDEITTIEDCNKTDQWTEGFIYLLFLTLFIGFNISLAQERVKTRLRKLRREDETANGNT